MDDNSPNDKVELLHKSWKRRRIDKATLLAALDEILKEHPECKSAAKFKLEILMGKGNDFKFSLGILFFKHTTVLITLVAILSILLFGYFHPTKETVTCDENLICKVEHQILWVYNLRDTIRLSYDSELHAKLFVRHHKNGGPYYYIKPVINDVNQNMKKELFIYEYKSIPHSHDYDYDVYMKQDIENFKNYLINPEKGFVITSNEGGIFILISIIFILSGVTIWYIVNNVEKVIKKK